MYRYTLATATDRKGMVKKRAKRIAGICAAAEALDVSRWHLFEVIRGRRKSSKLLKKYRQYKRQQAVIAKGLRVVKQIEKVQAQYEQLTQQSTQSISESAEPRSAPAQSSVGAPAGSGERRQLSGGASITEDKA